eukprot:387936-Pelagomonas_calceolata.AAC.1
MKLVIALIQERSYNTGHGECQPEASKELSESLRKGEIERGEIPNLSQKTRKHIKAKENKH